MSKYGTAYFVPTPAFVPERVAEPRDITEASEQAAQPGITIQNDLQPSETTQITPHPPPAKPSISNTPDFQGFGVLKLGYNSPATLPTASYPPTPNPSAYDAPPSAAHTSVPPHQYSSQPYSAAYQTFGRPGAPPPSYLPSQSPYAAMPPQYPQYHQPPLAQPYRAPSSPYSVSPASPLKRARPSPYSQYQFVSEGYPQAGSSESWSESESSSESDSESELELESPSSSEDEDSNDILELNISVEDDTTSPSTSQAVDSGWEVLKVVKLP